MPENTVRALGLAQIQGEFQQLVGTADRFGGHDPGHAQFDFRKVIDADGRSRRGRAPAATGSVTWGDSLVSIELVEYLLVYARQQVL